MRADEESDLMFHGKSSIKSRVSESGDSVRVSGQGSIKSNDYRTACALSDELSKDVDHSNRTAYEAHKRRFR